MKEDIESAIGELRQLIEGARSMPMSASAVVNRREVLGAIAALQGSIDDTLSRASEVVGDRDAVVAEGQSEAEEILRRAREDREKLVSDTDVYRLAQDKAEEATESARREADALKAEADQYVEERLANFELTLERTLETVRRGRARLMGGQMHALGDDSDVEGMELPDHLRRD
jgi:cell division septum initiation protein DivIVA